MVINYRVLPRGIGGVEERLLKRYSIIFGWRVPLISDRGIGFDWDRLRLLHLS